MKLVVAFYMGQEHPQQNMKNGTSQNGWTKPKLTEPVMKSLREIAGYYDNENAALQFLRQQVLARHHRMVIDGEYDYNFSVSEFVLELRRRQTGTPKPSLDILKAKFDSEGSTPETVCCKECARRILGCDCCCRQPEPKAKQGFHLIEARL